MLLWHKEKGKMAYPLQSFELKLINTKIMHLITNIIRKTVLNNVF